MCGIAGNTHDPDGARIEAMNAALVHRGPDDAGVHRDGSLSLGARRLSIIDVEGGHQPVSNEDASVFAVLNGEIYNHATLQEHLRERGHTLRSYVDTEVLVHLYEEYGDDLVHALEGMYAFAIWDARRGRLLIARDRFGEKPLFYREHAGRLSFASELSALCAGESVMPRVNPAALDAFFVYGYMPGDIPPIEGVRVLPPAHRLVWTRGSGDVVEGRYWSPPLPVWDTAGSLEDLTNETERLLSRSVRSRMVADRSLGIFLSGGVDSTLLAALAAQEASRPIKTFTVGYDTGAVNETGAAAATARAIGSDHQELILTESDIASLVPTLLGRMDVPIADQALVALHGLCAEVGANAAVIVGGEGADELFCGYPRYRWLRRGEEARRRLPTNVATWASSALRGAPLGHRGGRLSEVLAPLPTLERHVDWVTAGRRAARAQVYGPRLLPRAANGALFGQLERLVGTHNGSVTYADVMRLDQVHWLPDDVLAKADRAGMLASVEIRTPFLDRELAEFAASVPPDVHMGRHGKVLLRGVLEKVLDSNSRPRRKNAFRVPSDKWLRGPLAEPLRQQIAGGALYADGWFDRAAVGALARAHFEGRADGSSVLWPMLTLGLWYDRLTGHAG